MRGFWIGPKAPQFLFLRYSFLRANDNPDRSQQNSISGAEKVSKMTEDLYQDEAKAYMDAAEKGPSTLMTYINSKINDPLFSWRALHLSLVDLEERMTRRSMGDVHILIEAIRFFNAIEPYIRREYNGVAK